MTTTAPKYRAEFPTFDWEVPACVTTEWGFKDISWHNDACPSFECDVFVLVIDFADPAEREYPTCSRFMMVCEGETYLETDSWEDVRAFVEDGKRDFPAYETPAENIALAARLEAEALARC